MNERILHNGVVPIDNLNINLCLRKIKTVLDERKTDQQVITLTPKSYLLALNNQEFLEVLNKAFLVVPESVLLRFYSFTKPPILERVSGIELLNRILDECNQRQMNIALLGSGESQREHAKKNIKLRYPSIKVCSIPGNYNFHNTDDSKRIIDIMFDASPEFVIMAGKQTEAELWINRWLLGKGLNINLVANFGQGIDIVGGVRQDYKLARRLGFEWFLRVVFESNDFRSDRLRTFIAFGKMALFGKINKTGDNRG